MDLLVTEEQINEIKKLVSKNLQPNCIRSFLKVKDFTPLYLDLPQTLTKEQILYQLEQAFYNSQQITCPLQLKFTKFIKFTDSYLVLAEIFQENYKENKQRTGPLPAASFGIQQETGQALPIDNTDFSLFLAKKYPSNFTAQMLIQYVTNPLLYVEGSTMNTISIASILFYREKYFSSVELFNLLTDRFYMRNPLNIPSEQMQVYTDVFKMQVKAKVLQIIILWMTYYNDDFKSDDIKKVVEQFITDNETNAVFIDQFVQIKQLLEREDSQPYQEDYSGIIARISSDEMNGNQHRPFFMPNRPQIPVFSLYLGAFAAPKSILYTNFYQDETKYQLLPKYSVCPPQRYLQYASGSSLDTASVDLLTSLFYYFLYETYHNIHPRELIGTKFSKEETKNECPNVTLHIRRTNIINHFVAKSVILSQNKKETYSKFLNVAQKLYVLKAYDPCIAILSALEWAPVSRFELKEQMKGISKEYADNLFKLISLGDNFKTIRQLIDGASSTESIIPVLSLASKDCFMTEDNLDRYTNGYYVNLMRPMLVWRSVHAFLRFQAADMRVILFNKDLYQELCEQTEIPEDEMWQMSYSAKPKE